MTFKQVLAAGFGCTLLSGLPAYAAPQLTFVGAPDTASQVGFEVALPLRNIAQLNALLTALQDEASPQYHRWLTPPQFGAQFGPDAATLNRVTTALRNRGFAVETHSHSLHVTGPVALVETTLGTHLKLASTTTNARGTRIVADSALRLPAELVNSGAVVMSFGRQEAQVMSRRASGPLSVNNRYGNIGAYWYGDLKQAYQYPSYQTMVTVNGATKRLDGTGATIGVLMSSDILPADIKAVFDHEHFSTNAGVPDPTLFADIAINGGGGVTGGAFDEASLDTQEELTGAPGAHVILYNIPDLSDGNIFSGYVTAIEQNQVDLLSSSFGGCELGYSPQYNNGVDQTGVLRAYHDLFVQGNAQGITFLASSGDRAGAECPSVSYLKGLPAHFVRSVQFPGDDPNVTAVGGTNVVTVYEPGSLNSAYAGENAWSDPEVPYDVYGLGTTVKDGTWGAGGGYSRIWTAPAYQSAVDTRTRRRAMPDIGMQVGGCPNGLAILNPKTGQCDGGNQAINGNGNTDRSSVVVAINTGMTGGGFFGFIGTSVASPELAGALALRIEMKGRMGDLGPYIYAYAAKQITSPPSTYLHTNIPGYNGVMPSNVSATYSVSVGVGTPIVKRLVGASSAQDAGLPQTPSNP